MPEVKVEKSQAMARKEQGEQFSPAIGYLPSGRFFDMNPFRLMREFTDEMDRWARGRGIGSSQREWSPTLDVQRCDGNMVVAAELPGIRKEDVRVELTEDALIIEGERKQEHREDHEGYHQWERNYGHFYRAIPLPEGADKGKATAELRDGILKVSFPVSEKRKQIHEVPITEGSNQTAQSTK